MAGRTGRPKGDREAVRVTMYFDQDLIAKADRLAEKAGMSRSRLVSNILTEGLKSLDFADKVGVLDVTLLLRDFEAGLKSWVNQVREEGQGIKRDWESGHMVTT